MWQVSRPNASCALPVVESACPSGYYPPPMQISANNRISALREIEYRDSRHADLPHVVKFSGGRSSAAMALSLAESGALDAARGDVVLFANTSAEHPGTWEFAAACSSLLERDYGLPCLWYEFCTVEDASRGVYRRRESYRLVRRQPVEEDPHGYRSRGEVFEELLSYQGMLPNPHSRSCTARLKLYPAHRLLAEWLGGAPGPGHDGHYGNRAFLTPEAAERRYRAHGGVASPEAYIRRINYLTERPPSRSTQRWEDYTEAPIVSRPFNRPVGQAPMWGRGAVQFVTLLGLRGDEERRVNRVLSRSFLAEGAGGKDCSIRTQPPGERPYFPLYDAGWSESDIDAFWRSQDLTLDIPEGAGNCVFCFMKGTKQLQWQAQRTDAARVAGAPSDVRWWDEMETRYHREAPARDGCGVSKFGFFGVKGPTFAEIADPVTELKGRYATGSPACDCTD